MPSENQPQQRCVGRREEVIGGWNSRTLIQCWQERRLRFRNADFSSLMVACFLHMVSHGKGTTLRSPFISRSNTWPLSSSWHSSADLTLGVVAEQRCLAFPFVRFFLESRQRRCLVFRLVKINCLGRPDSGSDWCSIC